MKWSKKRTKSKFFPLDLYILDMPVDVKILIFDNDLNAPVSSATVEFFVKDVVGAAVATTITDFYGKAGVFVDPGAYNICVTTTNKKRIGTYVVKDRVPRHFSGSEVLNGNAFAERFQLTRYNHSAHYVEDPIEQELNWRI